MFWRRKRRKTQTTQARLDLGHRVVEVTLARSHRRTLGLQITREGRVVVRAPRLMPLFEIERFAREKAAWIERHLRDFARTQKARQHYHDGAAFPFLGQPFRLQVGKGERAQARLGEGVIHVRVPDVGCEAAVERAVRRLMKREGGKVFKARLDALFPPFAARGHKRPKVRTRWMKRRWGSLSSKGVMTLNLNLLRADIPLIDYVIVHELCHLEHMNHGRGFYKLLVAVMPDWKPRKKRLEELM